MQTGFKNHINRNTINISNFEVLKFKEMIKFLTQFGRYFLLLKKVFFKPEKPIIYYRQTLREFVYLGLIQLGSSL